MYDLIDSYYRREQRRVRQEVSRQFVQAEVTAEWVSKYLFGGEFEPSKPWDRYPDLFIAEKYKYDEKQRQIDLAKVSESRRLYAAEFNKRRKQG